MDERIARVLRTINDFGRFIQFEANIRHQQAMTPEVEIALAEKAATLSRNVIIDRTGLDLTNLSPAEERIVQAVSEYVGVMRRRGKDATRTLLQLKNRGLRGSAEIAVAKSKPTQGFQVLKDEDLEDLSYEQIILDFPGEFSERAAWYARRTLGLPNTTDRPPPKKSSVADDAVEMPNIANGSRKSTGKTNPNWTFDEHVLALDLYMRLRNASYSDEHPDVVALSTALEKLAKLRGMTGGPTFRNPNGVSMKLSNFRRLDPIYTAHGRVGLSAGNKLEEEVWEAFANEPERLRKVATTIYTEIEQADYGG